jgi:hypothetical protein
MGLGGSWGDGLCRSLLKGQNDTTAPGSRGAPGTERRDRDANSDPRRAQVAVARTGAARPCAGRLGLAAACDAAVTPRGRPRLLDTVLALHAHVQQRPVGGGAPGGPVAQPDTA